MTQARLQPLKFIGNIAQRPFVTQGNRKLSMPSLIEISSDFVWQSRRWDARVAVEKLPAAGYVKTPRCKLQREI